MQLKLYDKNTIKDLPIIDNYDAKYATDYLTPFVCDGVDKYIENAHGEMRVLVIDEHWVLPIYIPNKAKNEAYTSSIYTHYISYCLEELKELRNPILEKFSWVLLHFIGLFLKMGRIDNCVYINNWLLSTNLYTDFPAEYIAPIISFISKAFPQKAVVWNSINEFTTAKYYKELKNLNCLFLPSRSIYIRPQFDNLPKKANSNIRHDKKLVEKFENFFVKSEFSPRIKEFYNNLYILKYSKYNPQFTDSFIKHAIDKNLLDFYMLKDKNEKDLGVVGTFVRQNILTTPILGYDFSCEQSKYLYRQLAYKLFSICKDNNYIQHSSSGVGGFKCNRGAERYWEYRVVNIKNSKLLQKIAFKLIDKIISKIGKPIMDRKGL